MADKAGNTLRTARDLELEYGQFIRAADQVTRGDRIDLYRIKVKPRSALTITVTGNRRAPAMRLLNSNGKVFDEPQFFSDEVNARGLQRNSVRKGNYFIEVSYSGRDTRYSLNVGAFRRDDLRSPRTDPDPNGPGGPNNDLAPNRPQNGRRIEPQNRLQIFSDFVGENDRVDFYRLRLEQRSVVQAILFDVRNPARVALLDRKLNVVDAARANRNDPKDINLVVPKGRYYLRVRSKQDTRYSLTVATTSRRNPFFPGDGDDGTDDGEFTANLVRDINVGSESSLPPLSSLPLSVRPETFTEVNGTLFFVADDGINGFELWRSDGTQDGTQLVANINPGSSSSSPTDLVNVNGVLYFAADDGRRGRELWRSDGTPEGTTLAFDVNAGSNSSDPTDLVNFNGRVYFAAATSSQGREIWNFDPSAGNVTQLVVRPGTEGSDPTELTVSGGRLFFVAENLASRGRELWVSDGTATNAPQIIDIATASDQSSNPTELIDVNGTLFFTADDAIRGRELWQSNGGTIIGQGTRVAADINLSPRTGSDPNFLTSVNGSIYFAADEGLNFGRELYRYSPTDQEFVRVADINLTVGQGSDPTDLVNFNGTLIFAASDGTSVGREVYASDEVTGITRLAANVNPNANASSDPSDFTVVGSTVFFAADDGIFGRELWGLTDNV